VGFDLTPEQLHDLARGAAVLGTGGGGDPYIGRLLVEQASTAGHRVRIVAADELDPEELVIPTAQMGAPTVMVEKIPSGQENLAALRVLERHLGARAGAVMPIECGGINSMIPLLVAAQTGLPVVDADGMGRAFPELQMETFSVYGVSGSPMSLADEHGDTVIIEATTNQRMEWLARGLAIRTGGAAYICDYPMTAATVRRVAISGTLTLGIRIGRALREARARHQNPFTSLTEMLAATPYRHGSVLFAGKVIDVERRTQAGFTRGEVRLRSFDDARSLQIAFQNEHLLATIDGQVAAVVPDLICTLDADTGEPVTTEALRYGQRLAIYTISTPELMRTPDALATFGPQAFGLDVDYIPVEQLVASGAVTA